MAKKAEADKAEAKQMAEAMGSIEAAAAEAYARDREAAQAAEHAAAAAAAKAAGVWEWDEASGYYYNERHRWYFDPKTRWYYGGEPVAWAQDPPAASLPAPSRFGTAPHAGGPEPPFKKPAAAAASGSGAAAKAAGSGSGGGGGVAVTTVKKVVALPQHPQSLIGGHQMHHVGGRIGGAKGVGAGGDDGGKVRCGQGRSVCAAPSSRGFGRCSKQGWAALGAGMSFGLFQSLSNHLGNRPASPRSASATRAQRAARVPLLRPQRVASPQTLQRLQRWRGARRQGRGCSSEHSRRSACPKLVKPNPCIGVSHMCYTH
jgi:WW domain-binding protein 4